MEDKKRGTVLKVVSAILILLLLIGVIAIIFRFTNGFTDDFKTFYVEYQGKVLATTDRVELLKGQTEDFAVKYTFDSGKDEAREFSVKVVSASAEDAGFDYTVDGAEVSYPQGLDLSTAFALEKGERGFSITVPKTMREVLETYYDGKAVTLENEPDMEKNAYFKIIVTSYNEKSAVTISLLVVNGTVGGVELDKDSIVFGGVITYHIGYQVVPVRGSGQDYSGMVVFDCIREAGAGEQVTFTYSTENRIADPITLYGVTSGLLKTLTDAEPPSRGTLSFVMPAEDVYVSFSHVY